MTKKPEYLKIGDFYCTHNEPKLRLISSLTRLDSNQGVLCKIVNQWDRGG